MLFLQKILGDELILEYMVARIGKSEKQSIKDKASTTKFDSTYVTTIETDRDKPRITRVVFKWKWKKSIGKGDPLSQLTKCYSEVYGFKVVFNLLGFCCASQKLISWSQDKNYLELTYFPLNRHMLEISIAVCLETVIVNEILSLNMRDNLFQGKLKQELACIVVALQDCSHWLDTYYSQLTGEGKCSSYFPSPTLVPSVSLSR